MGLKLKNGVTGNKAYIIVALICAEAFLAPIGGSLSAGQWPTPIQVSSYAVTAAIQGITLLVSLFEKA